MAKVNQTAAAMTDPDLEMTTHNTSFLVDRLGAECPPNQYKRELQQNSLDTISEQLKNGTATSGTITWDVVDYPATNGKDTVQKLAITDTGTGMSAEELRTLMNKLASSGREQGGHNNFGIGAKVAGLAASPAGLIYESWKDGKGAKAQLWLNPVTNKYGLKPLAGSHKGVATLPSEDAPAGGHGTRVTIVGAHEDDNTYSEVAKYLNSRYFVFPENTTTKVRVNPQSKDDKAQYVTLTGEQEFLNSFAQDSGTVPLKGGTAHWWILEGSKETAHPTYYQGGGHVSLLMDNELYEQAAANEGIAKLQQFGIFFAHKRVVIYVEVDSSRVHANLARGRLLFDNEPLPWADWGNEFDEKMPAPLMELMENLEQTAKDVDRRKLMLKRLSKIVTLLPKTKSAGKKTTSGAAEPEFMGNLEKVKKDAEKEVEQMQAQIDFSALKSNLKVLKSGMDAKAKAAKLNIPEILWLSRADGTRDEGVLEDKAAEYIPDKNVLRINGDFRLFEEMAEMHTKTYSKKPQIAHHVKMYLQEWVELNLVETVLTAQAFKDSTQWTQEEVESALSPVGLTMAVSHRYHVSARIGQQLAVKYRGRAKAVEVDDFDFEV